MLVDLKLMLQVLIDIVDFINEKGTLTERGFTKICHAYNKGVVDSSKHCSKKRLLTYYFELKKTNKDKLTEINFGDAEEKILLKALQMKPIRTASGVATITVITKPQKCSSDCIYCPNDIRMPKSYLHDEPACRRAERNHFDPYLQVGVRLKALTQMGHVTDKVELIVLGGTWSDYNREYQIWFISELFRALNDAKNNLELLEDNMEIRYKQYEEAGLSSNENELGQDSVDTQRAIDEGKYTYNQAFDLIYGKNSVWQSFNAWQTQNLDNLYILQKENEDAKHRVVGLVIETRPDAINCENLTLYRQLGCTKIQMGVQSLHQDILDENGRKIKLEKVEDAFNLLRLFGFKIHSHFMLNLYKSNDKEVSWAPYDESARSKLLAECLSATSAFTRVSRVVRDFSANDIIAGSKRSNLRQEVEKELDNIQEMRYREIRTEDLDLNDLKLKVVDYETIATNEKFLQFVDSKNRLAGFLRLSLPKADFDRQELCNNELPLKASEAMIREVHVYGIVAAIHSKKANAQHSGLGTKLVDAAKEIASHAGYLKLNVISSVGTRGYYRKLGFYDNGLYQSFDL
ncbi:MAG: GNAT family N-acetyltransferase [Coriobacteriales bacterium]|nr:GNAT family N-acetyltransferase [Coriobacteriales bacterium]